MIRWVPVLASAGCVLISAGCVLITGDDLRAHDRGLRPDTEPDPTPSETATTDTDVPPTGGTAETGGIDPDGTFERATPITPTAWEPWTPTQLAEDAVDVAGDHDFWSLDLAAGEVVSLWTAAWEPEDPVVCDLVLRIWEQPAAPVVESDAVVLELAHTDPAVYYEAVTAGPIVVEVLDAGEWRGTTSLGGPDCDYELWGMPTPAAEVEPNNAIGQVDPADTSMYRESVHRSLRFDVLGHLTRPADIDMTPNSLAPGNVLTVSMWPGAQRGLGSPRLTIVDDHNFVLATTLLSDWTAEGVPFDLPGFLFYAPSDLQVFLAMSAAEVTEPSLYAMMIVEWSAGYYAPEEASHPSTSPSDVTFTRVGDRYEARFVGYTDGTENDGWLIDERTVPFASRTLTAAVQALSSGYGAGVALDVVDANETVLASSTVDLRGVDPLVRAMPLPQTLGTDTAKVVVRKISGSGGRYFLTLSIDPEE